MKVVALEILLIYIVYICVSTRGQTATLQTSSNSEETFSGQQVTLTCDVENGFDTSRHHIYWSKMDGSKETYLSKDRKVYNSVEVNLRRRLSITGDITQGFFNLHIQETKKKDAGIYICVLYDKRGIDKASIRLDLTIIQVRTPDTGYPKCEMSPKQPRLNDKVTFTCLSKGSIPKVSLNWMRADDTVSQHDVADSTRNAVFTQHIILETDNMVPFTCTAHGTSLHRPINCSVVPFSFPTMVNISPFFKKLTIGQNITLKCTAVAIPSPDRFKWTYGKGNKLIRISKSLGRFELLNNGRTLRIQNISINDNNIPVKCTVRNSMNIKGSKETTLKVISKSSGSNADNNPETSPRIPKPTATNEIITRRKPNRPHLISPGILMDEKIHETVDLNTQDKAPTGNTPLFDKHQPNNNGRAGLLTGGLIGIACLLGAIFLVALMLIKLKRDENSGNLVMTRKLEHTVTYTPERYLCSENGNNKMTNEDSDLSQAVKDRVQAEQLLRNSIIASQAIDNTIDSKNNQKKLKNDLSKTKFTETTRRRPNLVFKRFARPLTADSSPRSMQLKTNSLPSNCNLQTDSSTIQRKEKRTTNNVEGLLYADLDFTNVKTSQNIIPNSCETTYAHIASFLKK
ncbi:uncharacterized protein [Antedon mediterranea]|uniref:uncharacterized protein n=1 Tax=Antedon mediterranea TaxID=105859 RepID=UPI003AF4EA23